MTEWMHQIYPMSEVEYVFILGMKTKANEKANVRGLESFLSSVSNKLFGNSSRASFNKAQIRKHPYWSDEFSFFLYFFLSFFLSFHFLTPFFLRYLKIEREAKILIILGRNTLRAYPIHVSLFYTFRM